MSKRRKARELALQALYQLDSGNQDLKEILNFNWESKPVDKEIKSFANKLIKETYNNIQEIDEYIIKYSKNWDFSRINILEKNIIRFSTYSLIHQTEIPSKVIINEAVDIAKKYCGEDTFKFVNGILDEINKEIRKSKQPK